ncbi:MAG TPA: purine-nucleoside phosphorylase [Gemmataceae bacterium]|nr:purine-nucleoside phosphorylase [Gemmataceae bacterium]
MNAAADYPAFEQAVREQGPRVAIVLGSGIRLEPPRYQPSASITFADVPGLVDTTVAGHSGWISVGACGDCAVLVFHGRLHYYEGHSWERVGAPIRLAAGMGVATLILTNAAGGIHETLGPGSLMAIRDHLSWQRPGSWRGPGPAACQCPNGERATPYSGRLVALLQELEREQGRELFAGIYAALTGPCYETPAEIRAVRAAGGDAVGMSTAHEVETGRALGLECAAISCVTNKAAGLGGAPLDHRDVLEVARRTADRLADLIERLLRRL